MNHEIPDPRCAIPATVPAGDFPAALRKEAQLHSFGFSWEQATFPEPRGPDILRSIWRAKKVFAEVIHDITVMEGNPFTVPEIQTLLEGITVGGRKVSDAEQVLNQKDALLRLFEMVESGKFEVSAECACELQGIAARGEALEEGVFRSGKVGISGTAYQPPDALTIPGAFSRMADAAGKIVNPIERGASVFLSIARTQCFWDGNKRTGRLMMNGILLSAGQDIVSVPAAEQAQFNAGMLTFYDTANGSQMMAFLANRQIRSKFE